MRVIEIGFTFKHFAHKVPNLEENTNCEYRQNILHLISYYHYPNYISLF